MLRNIHWNEFVAEIDAERIRRHWRSQLQFAEPELGAALRMHAISLSMRRAGSCLQAANSSSLRFPLYAYIVPDGTMENLQAVSGENVLANLAATELGARLTEFRTFNIGIRTEIVSALMNAALYSEAFKLVGDEIELDPEDEIEAWYMYQLARLIQRVNAGNPAVDEVLDLVVTRAPHGWQRSAAVGLLIARYARIRPSQPLLKRYSELAAHLLNTSGERAGGFVGTLWTSRLYRALALSSAVGADAKGVWMHLELASEAQSLATELANCSESAHLVAMNQRLVLEAKLKATAFVKTDTHDLIDQFLRCDPGCSDVHYIVGAVFRGLGDIGKALEHFYTSYRLGTLRSRMAAIAILDLANRHCAPKEVTDMWHAACGANA